VGDTLKCEEEGWSQDEGGDWEESCYNLVTQTASGSVIWLELFCHRSVLRMACEICSHVTPRYFSTVAILKI